MIRADLSWALSSVLPHAGKLAPYSVVGLSETSDDLAQVWATDGYTTGIARLSSMLDEALGTVVLPASEARDLERFVRPTRVGERTEAVNLVYVGSLCELHVATESDSAVFECTEHSLTLDYLLDAVNRILALPYESAQGLDYQPDLFARFSKAKRSETDRLTLYPRRPSNGRNGVAVVTVGSDFLGAISGLTYEDSETDTVTEFLKGAA